MKSSVKLLIPFVLLAACAPSRFVKPLQKGEKVLTFNTGGPLIGYKNATIPMPLSAITYGYGYSDNTTAFVSIHTTSLLFGVIQTELGCVHELAPQKGYRPGVSGALVANLALDRWEWNFRFWPQIDVNAYWNYGAKKHLFYIGVSNWFELRTKKDFERPQQTHWIPNPHLGNVWVHNKWSYGLELKWLAPMLDNQPNVVDYTGIRGKGALGTYLSVSYKF